VSSSAKKKQKQLEALGIKEVDEQCGARSLVKRSTDQRKKKKKKGKVKQGIGSSNCETDHSRAVHMSSIICLHHSQASIYKCTCLPLSSFFLCLPVTSYLAYASYLAYLHHAMGFSRKENIFLHILVTYLHFHYTFKVFICYIYNIVCSIKPVMSNVYCK